ncbi:DUF222 domain-containing protein [Jatrophihabitans sp. YIM 134969]
MVAVDEMVPSPDLLRALLALDPLGFDDEERVASVAGWERMIAFCTAHQNDVMAAAYRDHAAPADGGEPDGDAGKWWAEQLGLALGVAGTSAYHRMMQAVTLVEVAPAISAQLRIGAIGVHHARVAANALRVVEPEVGRTVEREVVDDPGWRTPSQLERALQAAIIKHDPEGAKARNRARRRERDVRIRAEADGMCSLWALLPAEQGQAVAKTIDAHARSSKARNAPGDDRTLANCRADALAALLLRPLHPTTVDTSAEPSNEPSTEPGTDLATAPRMHGQRPEIQVVVGWTTLMGLDDLPGFLHGHGVIDAATVRRIAYDSCATWRRILTDPASGQLLDYGRKTYSPPRNLEDFVIARDQYCRFPTCDRPAVTCDLDHRHDWDKGCQTREKCLDALCRRHHRLKHEGGWSHERDPDDNSSIWTDPAGGQHRKPAAKLPIPEPEPGDPPF